MKKSYLVLGCVALFMASCSTPKVVEPVVEVIPEPEPEPIVLPDPFAPKEWKLVWEENFQGDSLNANIWSKIPRGPHDWNNTMSDNDDLYSVGGGVLTLRGMVNTDPSDESKYITGGVYTKGKKAFNNGRLEISARLQGAQGAWPAIWLMPESQEVGWPACGEIDIMERLNHDAFAYQTVHSDYTVNKGQTANPKSSATGAINPNGFNVYAVEIWPTLIRFLINGNVVNAYPRLEPLVEGQFPFPDKDWYLMLDMQLGGQWVGEVNPDQLPVSMEIDYVRYYE